MFTQYILIQCIWLIVMISELLQYKTINNKHFDGSRRNIFIVIYVLFVTVQFFQFLIARNQNLYQWLGI